MVDRARPGAALDVTRTDFGEDTPERVAKRLPLPQRQALSALTAAGGALDCHQAGIPQSVLRGLRNKGLARTPDERSWASTAQGQEVAGLLADDCRTPD